MSPPLILIRLLVFQSTHPGRGATYSYLLVGICNCVSIHAPRAGCDRSDVQKFLKRLSFNPRTPGGVRRPVRLALYRGVCFNPRTPGGVRLNHRLTKHRHRRFNPRTPGGVRRVR